MKVLVIGATGMLGKPVTRQLVAAGHEVTALVRRADAALPQGVRAVVGDLFDATSLVTAMQGQDAVYLNLATQPTDREAGPLAEREGLSTILAAMRTAGVRRVAALSALVAELNSEWWVLRVKREAEKTLLESGLDVTLFRASTFMENLDGGMRQGAKLNLAGTAQFASWFLAGDDLGKWVARSLASPQKGTKVYFAQGPESVFTHDAAARFVAAYGKEKLTVQRAPLAVLSFIGLFSPALGFVAKLMGALNRYEDPFRAKATWDELGTPTTTIESFARAR